ncbi:MAG: DASS family sodium-coupled anion symporter [Flavobacteriaceae bacterium]|jgi:sodium-dependent dicarboxylate transporter 2/3/5|nr:DASS family sodium-coupled anion symporter [Flavobacteriaceae bacterium]MDB4058630.1 DASS family sodium-coupled anion symporter [Flavobacteriaceae bacterium]MDB9795531.1 DASS family sodium-coupled anion symporter [Flavobacteriaceae bacterium]MDC0107651.1 DASS family sodium-coupled anion symporter [Flavobacteriaceae bacterium]MDC1495964.1 DASS family sodium-coupled anion symporter [Flavobacteriaceae bacterium]|tara:strand:+ start:4357 stop:5787 length:1431 start_codon:yes stop_codon:yes gene_type:complete
MSNSKKVGLFLGPVFFLLILLWPQPLLSTQGDAVIAVALWMVTWWLTEAVSISVTALLPLLLFPLLDIMPIAEVGNNYGSPIIFLFFGGFVMALALEKVNLHRRIALNIIRITGTTPNKVVLGFMIATASLSMWISNTATVVVMLPIAMSVIKLLIDDVDGFTKKDRNFAVSVLLGIAFSANAGGIATVIGTPPNSILIGLLENEYQIEISFLKWMVFALPFSIIMIGLSYITLVHLIFPSKGLNFSASNEVIQEELRKLGPTRSKEKMVLGIFAVTVSLWIFRTLINSVFPSLGLSDTMISMFAAISLFAVPFNLKKGDFILDWKDTEKLAWGILILFGGGLALAKGMSVSGIVDQVSQSIAAGNFSITATASLLILLMLFMTELMSNVALVAVLAPVVAGIAIGLGIPMVYLLIPVTMASSCAFMLPMATPPNAIVFASGFIEVKDMVKAGILLNLVAVLILIGLFEYIIPLLF